ncbi:MAG: DegT/DnrJ/EryC1/StrS family aminotransferase [Acidobacteria bacterium]|nr:DegT/DnrJ/EryC1/StrS family aminotransferase [Acidobacteriota bacterium]
MTTLALLGGKPVRTTPFPRHPIIGPEEKDAVAKVLDSAELSGFIAVQGPKFLGGRKVREFEERVAAYHGVKYAVSFNSATAALHAAVVAVGVNPGEEVIVPPYTFTATAACALMHNAIPVFADVEDDIYCLDPKAVAAAITPLAKAMIPVHLFGHPADIDRLLDVARMNGLKVIEDCAQAPGALYKGRPVGTFGDCAVYSFTENKTITTGEGGMLITNDAGVAEAARLVRNHGEVIEPASGAHARTASILGWNYRLTELQAALGIVQFAKLDALNSCRRELAGYLSGALAGNRAVIPPSVRPDCTHVFYNYALKYDAEAAGIPRDVFVKALAAEGIPFGAGYVPPLYLNPVYQNRDAFAFKHYTGSVSYDKGICPVTERLHERDLVLTQIARSAATTADMDDVVRGIEKVLSAAPALRDYALAGSRA